MGVIDIIKNRKLFKGEGHKLSDESRRTQRPPSPSKNTCQTKPPEIYFLFKCPAVCDESYKYDELKAIIIEFVSKTHEDDLFIQKLVQIILERRDCSLFHTTLSRILTNLVSDPENDKFRSLRATNRLVVQGIGDFPHGFELVQLIGFEFDSETSIYRIPPPINSQKIQNFQELLNSAMELYRPVIDRDLKIYKPAFKPVETPDSVEVTSADIRGIYIARQRQVERMETLVSANFWKREKPVYKYSRVRLILPDEWRIECSFESCESLSEIVSVLVDHMEEGCSNDFTFVVGNRRICEDVFDRSIFELELGQAAAMRVHFSLERLSALGQGWRYLKSGSIEKYS